MSFYDKLVQVISRSCENMCYYDHCDCPPVARSYDNALDLVTNLGSYFHDKLVVEKLLSDQHFVDQLKAQGWVNIKQAEEVSEKATLGTEFFLWNLDRRNHYATYPTAVDFDKLTDYDAKELAKDDTKILCTITKGSLKRLNGKVYRSYLAAKKKLKEKQQKAKDRAAKRAATIKQKKLAEAKELLKEAGEL